MTQIGAGIIGLGVGEQHIAGYRQPPTCDVVSLCDLSETRLKCVASRHPQCRQTTCWQDLLQDPQVHVVSIASYDDVHGPQTVAALEAGKHTFVEKPLCRSAAELAAIRTALASRTDLHLASNLVLRSAPVYRRLRSAILQDELGEIYAMDGEYLYGRLEKITAGWRSGVAGYSVMQGGGIHLADLMLWLTGQRPSAVRAIGNRICTRAAAFRENDYVTATFQFASGMIARITANFGCVHPHQHVLRVFGTKATFLLDDQGPRLITSRQSSVSPQRLDEATLPSSKAALIPKFLSSIIGGSDREQQAQQEFDTITVCLAADRSLREETTIGITYDE